MHIRPAAVQELEAILSVYDNARAFMRAHKNPTQWSGGYPQPELLKEDIAKEQLFVIEENGVIHGVFAYILGEDPTYQLIEDGAWPNALPYGTIHRIASDGTVKGILKLAVDFALTHCKQLRADTHHDNYVMQNAMTRLGFQYCGIIYVSDGSPRKAYQLNI